MRLKKIAAYALVGVCFSVLTACTSMAKIDGAADKKQMQAKNAERHYTFAWNYVDGSDMSPRGGTSKGVPVTLDTTTSKAWLKLREAGISDFERDRRAILAMAGEYRVNFDFIEVAGFTENYKPQRPYHSWTTEKVYVIEDKGDFISLQHVLLMQMVEDEGDNLPPVLVKHWRQDWKFEPTGVLTYQGHNTWQQKTVDATSAKGAWSQTVYQVDDSPRYGGVASWQHFGNYSSWNTDTSVWRPLPRREYSMRSDYQVLLGNNRHTILPTGWVHEQQNNKVALDKQGKPTKNPVVAREFGFNRYERIKGFDFSLSDQYVKNTDAFWKVVRKEWAQQASKGEPLYLITNLNKAHLYFTMFDYAEKINQGESPTTAEVSAFVKDAVQKYQAKK